MQNRLKELRDKRGLSQTEIEKLAGWSSGICSRMENGEQEFKIHHLEDAGRALNVPPLAIIGGDELTLDERRWLECYRIMSDGDRERWLKILTEFTVRDPLSPGGRRQTG